MNLVILTSSEVCSLIGVSEKTLYKDFKKCMSKLDELNISWEGKGKKRCFFFKYETVDNVSKSPYEIAYDTFKDIVFKEWHFDCRVNIKKLLLYMASILKHHPDKNILTLKDISKSININRITLSKYKDNLINNKIIMPKHLSKRQTRITTTADPEPKIICNDVFDSFYNLSNKDSSNDSGYIKNLKALKVFESMLGYTKIWAIYKTEFTPSVMSDPILLEIISLSFIHVYSDDPNYSYLSQYLFKNHVLQLQI